MRDVAQVLYSDTSYRLLKALSECGSDSICVRTVKSIIRLDEYIRLVFQGVTSKETVVNLWLLTEVALSRSMLS